jgi:hypothetical protein
VGGRRAGIDGRAAARRVKSDRCHGDRGPSRSPAKRGARHVDEHEHSFGEARRGWSRRARQPRARFERRRRRGRGAADAKDTPPRRMEPVAPIHPRDSVDGGRRTVAKAESSPNLLPPRPFRGRATSRERYGPTRRAGVMTDRWTTNQAQVKESEREQEDRRRNHRRGRGPRSRAGTPRRPCGGALRGRGPGCTATRVDGAR